MVQTNRQLIVRQNPVYPKARFTHRSSVYGDAKKSAESQPRSGSENPKQEEGSEIGSRSESFISSRKSSLKKVSGMEQESPFFGRSQRKDSKV